LSARPPHPVSHGRPLRAATLPAGELRNNSCIIKRYCEKRFVPKYLATIGIDYGVTKVQVRDREIKVNIFDMAGHPFFYEVRNEFYKDTQGVILVYDVGQKESFDALDAWLAEMKQELGPHGNMDNIVFVVCANKIDCTKHRSVDESEGRLWAESRGFLYFETSAQTGEGINEMFQVTEKTARVQTLYLARMADCKVFSELLDPTKLIGPLPHRIFPCEVTPLENCSCLVQGQYWSSQS
uniref:DnaJ heat shock protein family (Hsp40) member C27 n=1 Tax=Pavo cristatus TaxID=9049 RepID=A0A8C9FCZ5_PAVCR